MTNRFKAPVTSGVFMNGSAAFWANWYLSSFFASTVVGNTARGIRTLSRSTNFFMAILLWFLADLLQQCSAITVPGQISWNVIYLGQSIFDRMSALRTEDRHQSGQL